MRRSLNFFFWFLFLSFFGTVVGGAWYFIHEHYAPVAITLEREKLSNPYEPIVIHFSQSMRPKSLAGKVQLNVPVELSWKSLDTELVLTPQTEWPIGTTLSLFLGQGQTRSFSNSAMRSFTLTTPTYPKVIEVSPKTGSRDVLLGIEDPIRVTFDRPVGDFYIDFRIDPVVAVVYQNNDEKTVFEILPQEVLLPGKEYVLEIYSKWRGEDDTRYTFLGESRFTTLPPAPITWNRNLLERIEEAKRFTNPKKETGKYIDINLRSQIMTLFENGRAIDAYVVSSGKRGMDTPKGEFQIHNQALRPWSKKYSLYMPYWQAITPDGQFGIHELPEWPGGYKEGANHLGTPVSHGCVRLGIGPAKRVYEWATVGTPVVIY